MSGNTHLYFMDFGKALNFIKRNNIKFHLVQELRYFSEVDNYSSFRARYDGVFITFWKKYTTDGGIERREICDKELCDAIENDVDNDYDGVIAVFDLCRMIHLTSNRNIFYEESRIKTKLDYTSAPSSITFNIWHDDDKFQCTQQVKYNIKDFTPDIINKFKIQYFSKEIRMGDIEICRETLLDDVLNMGWYLDIDVTYEEDEIEHNDD